MRMQMFQQAITSKTSVGFEAAKGKDDPHPKSPKSFNQFGQVRTQKMSYQKQVNSELAAIQSELQTLENEAKYDQDYKAQALALQQSLNQNQAQAMPVSNANNNNGGSFVAANREFDVNENEPSSANLMQVVNQAEDRWFLGNKVEAPRTPYEVRAGFIIPAILVTGINSDLPGQLIAQVSRNVYDTPTGTHLVIPQGTRLMGVYSNDIDFGQARIMGAWQRLIFPDGDAGF